MKNHQATIYEIKNDFLDLWANNRDQLSYSEWFNGMRPKLSKYFAIEYAEFYIYDIGRKVYLPIENYDNSKTNKEHTSRLFTEEFIRNADNKSIQQVGNENINDFISFTDPSGKPLALVLFKSTPDWMEFSLTPYFKEFKDSVSTFIVGARRMGSLIMRERKFRRLFNVTELFNATMESDVILDAIIDTVESFFPALETELLLSHEENQDTKAYKLFDYMNERPSAIEAFVSGEMTSEPLSDSNITLINAPIKGRQAIYGILKLKAPTDHYLSATQLNLIRMLTNTAGSSLENASLYNQSHRLIEDLQLINETSRKLNSNMPFNEMIAYLKQQLTTAFKPSEIAFVFTEDNQIRKLYASSDYFSTSSGEMYVNYTIDYLNNDKSALFDANFSQTVNEHVEFEALIGIPITNQAEIVGFVLLLHKNPYFFSFESFKLMQSLIWHSSLALSNSMLRDQLQKLVDKDHLTKLYARRYLDQIIERSLVEKEGGTLILFDIDDFKRVNDAYGHDIGDNVLRQLGLYLAKSANEKGVAARWGGEEFAVYCPLLTEKDGIILAKQLVKNIPLITEPAVTISVGLTAWIQKDAIKFKDLFKFTDAALYKAKSGGKNRIAVHGRTSFIEI